MTKCKDCKSKWQKAVKIATEKAKKDADKALSKHLIHELKYKGKDEYNKFHPSDKLLSEGKW